MTLAILIAISCMWVPVAILFLGKGEAKGTGAICAFVGATTVVGAFVQAAVFKDVFVAGLLFPHGLLYCTVAYALLAGLDDLRSVGNISLTVCIISLIYTVVWLFGGPVAQDGKQLIAATPYFAFCAAGYTVLTLEVWLNAYGKFPASALAWSLIIWAVVGLWIPAFDLMVAGALPF